MANPNTWIYLSPHLDDVALSCGGLVWEQAHSGNRVEVWTVCAGDPPPGPLSPFAQSLHERWETDALTPTQRRAEDQASCEAMGAAPRHFSLPDCIYRRHPYSGRPLYASEEALFIPLDPGELPLLDALSRELATALAEIAAPGSALNLVCPLTVGGHVDHRLARAAAEQLRAVPLRRWYYADYPYVLTHPQVEALLPPDSQPVVFPLSPPALEAWIKAVAAHVSQVGGFWPTGADEMRAALHDYAESMGGVRLWVVGDGGQGDGETPR